MMSTVQLVERVNRAIEYAEWSDSGAAEDVLNFQGMTSPKIKHFLNMLCSEPDSTYFEIGLATGSTHFAALSQNKQLRAFGADLWLTQKNGLDGETKFLENYEKFLGSLRTKLFSGDCFKIDLSEFFGDARVDVYFYDGGHSADDHLHALTYFKPIFTDKFICVIDDWNDDRVQAGTKLAISTGDFRILHQRIMPARIGATPPHWGDMSEWWNGMAIFVLEVVK